MADPLARLAEWLQPFTVMMSPEALATRRAVVDALAASQLDAAMLVSAAHGELPGDGAPLRDAVAAGDPSLVISGNESLIAVLAAAAVIARLSGTSRDDATLHALLVQSARFVGFEAAVDALADAAVEALANAGRRQRQRLEPAETPREVARLLANAKAASDVAADQGVLDAVRARDGALRAVARRVEDMAQALEDRLQLVEEELEMLWWSRSGHPIDCDEPWERLDPSARAARAPKDVASLLTRLPAPLQPDADAEAAIADVAVHLQVPQDARRHPLMPLTTYRLIVSDLGEDELEAAARVFDNLPTPVRAADTLPLIDLAAQVLCELQIAARL